MIQNSQYITMSITIYFYRATASTKMNDVSSRSHAIFTLTFMQVSTDIITDRDTKQ